MSPKPNGKAKKRVRRPKQDELDERLTKQLRDLYDPVLSEPVPKRLTDLLKKLDQR